MLEQVSDVPLKRCPTCPEGQQWHPVTSEFFGRNKSTKDGLQTHCKVCRSKRAKRDNARPEVRVRTQARRQAYYAINPEALERRRARNRITANEYYHRPGARERKQVYDKERRSALTAKEQAHANWKSWSTENQAYRRTYYKAYRSRPDARERRRVAQAHREARKKAIPGTHTPEQIHEQLKRQKYRCYYAACGFAKFEKDKEGNYIYHIDHTFPLDRVAGTDIPANDISYLVLACPLCNGSKGNRFPWEWSEGGKLL